MSIVSNYDNKTRVAERFLVIPYNIPTSNVAAYFPETNILVPHNHYATTSNTPISKSVVITIEKVG